MRVPSGSLQSFLKMQINICDILAVLLIFLTIIHQVKTNPNKQIKLSIGIKKRPPICLFRSLNGDMIEMHYKGLIEDGTEFDRSPVNKPFSFEIGGGRAIKGLDQGLLNMCEGEERKLIIPSELAYGASGVPPSIPPNATVIFHVELIEIDHKKEGNIPQAYSILRKLVRYLIVNNITTSLEKPPEKCHIRQ